MNKKVRKATSLLLALLITLTLNGCGGTAETGQTGNEPANKDYTIVVGIASAITTLDPAMHRDRTTETVLRNMFDGLVTRTPDMQIVPEIAESWENISPTEWEFKIRQGIKFHNGEDLTADDVVFTYERILKEGGVAGQSSPRKGLLGTITSVEKVDDYTVRFILSDPWPVFLAMLPNQQIVPKDYITEKGDEYFAANPVGAGPFKFVSANLNEEVVMERYDDYYGGSPDLPPVGPAPAKRVLFKIIPEPSSRIAALQTGEISIMQDVPASAVEMLQASDNVTVKTTSGTRVNFFAMNVTQKPFDDVKVRQAMNYAINIDEIIQNVLEGSAKSMVGPVPSNSFAHDDELKPYGYDPEKAKQLITEAGYPNGFDLVIDCEAPEKEITEAAALQLRNIGINATTRVWDWGVLKPLLVSGERQMVMNYWGNSTLDPFDLLNPMYMTDGTGNYSKYSNPRVDQLLTDASKIVDADQRKAMYDEVQEILYNDAPRVYAYVNDVIEAASSKIEGWEPSSEGRMNLHDVTLSE
jgi:peptide/nickel transport system substrate-binding protein